MFINSLKLEKNNFFLKMSSYLENANIFIGNFKPLRIIFLELQE